MIRNELQCSVLYGTLQTKKVVFLCISIIPIICNLIKIYKHI